MAQLNMLLNYWLWINVSVSTELKDAHVCKSKTEDTTKDPKENVNGKSAVKQHSKSSSIEMVFLFVNGRSVLTTSLLWIEWGFVRRVLPCSNINF